MIPGWNGYGKKARGDLAGLILTAEVMIADVQNDKSDGGMGMAM